jgi:hypothetical protein
MSENRRPSWASSQLTHRCSCLRSSRRSLCFRRRDRCQASPEDVTTIAGQRSSLSFADAAAHHSNRTRRCSVHFAPSAPPVRVQLNFHFHTRGRGRDARWTAGCSARRACRPHDRETFHRFLFMRFVQTSITESSTDYEQELGAGLLRAGNRELRRGNSHQNSALI